MAFVPMAAGTHTGAGPITGPHLNMEGRTLSKSAYSEPATDRQIDYLQALMKDRDSDIAASDVDDIVAAWKEAEVLTKGFTSEKIEEYKALPHRDRKSAETGYYTLGGAFYVVVANKAGTGTYAKKLVQDAGRWHWAYEKGTVRFLADLKPMTVEDAVAFGHLHGVCAVCLRPLTDPKNVAAGIGKTCAKRLASK